MNHTTDSLPPSPAPAASDTAAPLSPGPGSSDEEPDSPGRSPLSTSLSGPGEDPLLEIVTLLSGMGIAILSLAVPVLAVLADPARPALLSPLWSLDSGAESLPRQRLIRSTPPAPFRQVSR